MVRYCECRTHADGRDVCGHVATIKVTLRTTTGVQGPFFYCSDCAGGITNSNAIVEKLVDPNAPTDPAPPYVEPKCPTCGALSYASEEPGWRVCVNLHRFEECRACEYERQLGEIAKKDGFSEPFRSDDPQMPHTCGRFEVDESEEPV